MISRLDYSDLSHHRAIYLLFSPCLKENRAISYDEKQFVGIRVGFANEMNTNCKKNDFERVYEYIMLIRIEYTCETQ